MIFIRFIQGKRIMSTKGNHIYSRISKGWKSKYENKLIEKLGCTKWIEYRKWWGATERLYPSEYKWYIVISDLGKFPSLRSAEQTIFRHSFFSRRRVRNGAGSGDEFFEFSSFDSSLQKACEILVQYNVVFKVIEGDPFHEKPNSLPKEEEELPYDPPLPALTQQETKEIEPRSYQLKCIQRMLTVLTGVIVAATGIGKTIIMCMYMKHAKGRYLIVVPSKKLVNQTVHTCEKILGDTFIVRKYDKCVKNWFSNQENVVIIGLYQSSHKMRKLEEIDCILFDECHSTVVLNPPTNNEGKRIASRFQKLLSYKCRKFFFTATEKNIQANGKVISMDNEEVYGPVIFRYDLASAVNNGWLCDYMFHLVATKNRVNSCIKYVKRGYKTVIFCGKQKSVEKVYEKLCEKLPKTIKIYKLGNHDSVETNTRLFSEYEGQGVIIACRKITMGYDEPQIDTVIHYNLTTSSIMVHQRNGRAFRLHNNKVMATLVFLCDVSGDDEKRKEKIRQLHRPIAHLKMMDSRFEKRVEDEILKGREEFKMVDVIVDGKFDVSERKEVYDRCWNMIDEKQDVLKDELQRCIIYNRRNNIRTKSMYRLLSENDKKLISYPEKHFERLWTNWYDFLGIETTSFIKTKDEWKARCKELGISSWSQYKELQNEYSAELPLMPEEIYSNFSNFDDEIGRKPFIFINRH